MKSASTTVYSVAQIKRFIYLKEIFLLSIAGFGGPGAHLNFIIKTMVVKRNYLKEQELLELYSFCQLLPGPTSTQIITALGYKLGGPILAALSLLIWILPVSILMTVLVVVMNHVDSQYLSTDLMRFIPAMAVGFIAAASIQMFKLMNRTKLTVFLYALGAIGAIVFRSPWIFPVLLLIGGGISRRLNREEFPPYKAKIRPKWSVFFVFAGIFIASSIIGNLWHNKPVLLFQNSFQFGSIVFGGGNVLIPMMFKQYVVSKEYLSAENFLMGVGLLQALPGPVFSISTFANGMAMADGGLSSQILGSSLGTIGIFLPGILIIFFLFPIWTEMKKMPLYKKSIEGIASVSAGLVLAAAYLLFVKLDYFDWEIILVCALTLALVLIRKVPSPIIVLLTLVAGWLLPI